jgi:hypothetical protein
VFVLNGTAELRLRQELFRRRILAGASRKVAKTEKLGALHGMKEHGKGLPWLQFETF